ncbi:hypothetical protein [Desulforhopalus singaporensis]|uniref:Uncharacterized protein n=1 Tax=Desulforhopalus singaporensis TaxID=91360 RepID=A0A1H0TGT0_9BACT|nr:hypothetical protein [Desulforhopalus singaporensis]SDP53174.1 hypothetical protein SAMN05660330_03085 [Desulforhopalus singaporensis]
MHNQSRSKYNSHLIKLIVALIVAGGLGYFARQVFMPASMGTYGHYRGDDIVDQLNVPIRLQTNESCFQCHRPIRQIHKEGIHNSVSCEICHGPFGDHIQDGKKVGVLPVKKGKEITQLCLRCHNKVIQARPRKSIKMIGLPEHLEQKGVRVDHTCDQCHMVHDPLLWINQAKRMMGIKEAI